MKVDIRLAKKMMTDRLRANNYSEKTLAQYVSALDTLESYLLMHDISDLREVGEENARGYVDYVLRLTKGRDKKPLSGVSMRKKIVYVKKAFETLVLHDLVFTDPFGKTGSIKNDDALPKEIMTRREILLIFAMPDIDTYIGYRDRTIMEMLYGTGMRLGELVNLDIYDIDFTGRVVFIRQGKGHKDRFVPCTEIALRFLKEYMDVVRPALCFLDSREKALFLSVRGRRMTGNAFRTALAGYRKKAKTDKRITPHVFRHTFATHMLEGGANVRYIQEILGHEQLSTTMIYTRVAIKELKKEIRRYHPRENELLEDKDVLPPEHESLYRHIRG